MLRYMYRRPTLRKRERSSRMADLRRKTRVARRIETLRSQIVHKVLFFSQTVRNVARTKEYEKTSSPSTSQ